MLTSLADKAMLVEKLWTSRRLEAASLQDSLPHNVRVAETEGRPPFPPPPNHPPVNPYLQTNTLPQPEKYSYAKIRIQKFKVTVPANSRQSPSPTIASPAEAPRKISVKCQLRFIALNGALGFKPPSRPLLWICWEFRYQLTVNLLLHRFSSMWCFIFFGTLIGVSGQFSYLQGHRYGRFFCFRKLWEST